MYHGVANKYLAVEVGQAEPVRKNGALGTELHRSWSRTLL